MEQQSNFLFGKPVKWQQSLWYQMKCLLRYRGAADFHKEYRLCSSSSGILLIVVLSCLIHHTVPISSKSRSYVSFSIYINNGGSTSFRFTWTIRKIAPQHTDIFIALFPPRLHTYHFHFGQDIAVGIGVIFSAGLHISWVSYHQLLNMIWKVFLCASCRGALFNLSVSLLFLMVCHYKLFKKKYCWLNCVQCWDFYNYIASAAHNRLP